jgi:hypothetical protein
MIASIHQPMYLPWQPYFGKIACSDIFIFLDDVQYPGGKSFFNRNVIKGATGPIVLTAPVTGRGERPLVKDLHLEPSNGWRKSHWKSIVLNYRKAAHFSLYADIFEDLYLNNEWLRLADICTAIICKICEVLNFETKFYWASKLDSGIGHGTNHLIALLDAVGAKQYLSGAGEGSMRYMDVEKFSSSGIDVAWHKYEQQPYKQLRGDFFPDTCIFDLLFNCGPSSLDVLTNNSLVSRETFQNSPNELVPKVKYPSEEGPPQCV